MQRKNYILNSNNKRSGFAMIMAIIVIVVIATLMTLSLTLTAQSTKTTTDLYLYEQTVLYAKSAAELALLDIAQNGCQNSYTNNFDGMYDATITMRYIYMGTVGACTDYFNITTPEQNGSVLMDITVSTDAGTEPIRYFRRVIQKL